MAADKPWSEPCERNKGPILEVLRAHFADRRAVLEIGSGTGQHAAFFAAELPHLVWQASDRAANLPGIRLWVDDARLPNLPPPLTLDVEGAWPAQRFDAVFSANTCHIMHWPQVERLFAGLPAVMTPDAKLVIYGPFNDHGRFTSDSNAAFDASLRRQDPGMGLRDIEAVDALARAAGFLRVEERAMPANNRCVVWVRNVSSSTDLS
jgi:cyclopropane fatty-acyl-phospholipid synthase-like methyltransferase